MTRPTTAGTQSTGSATVPTGTLLLTTNLYGYPGNSNSPWHSDAQTITQLLAANKLNSGSPSLTIRSGGGVNLVQMTLIATDGSHQLNKFGEPDGTQDTLTAAQLSSITEIQVWGYQASGYATPRLGRIMFEFADGSNCHFGDSADQYLGAYQPPQGSVLLGFTGLSGSMVDGLSFLFAQSPLTS